MIALEHLISTNIQIKNETLNVLTNKHMKENNLIHENNFNFITENTICVKQHILMVEE